MVFSLITLAFKRSHGAAASVLRVVTWLAALIGLQKMTQPVGAAVRVARINRRASRKQRDGLCRAAVVPQCARRAHLRGFLALAIFPVSSYLPSPRKPSPAKRRLEPSRPVWRIDNQYRLNRRTGA